MTATTTAPSTDTAAESKVPAELRAPALDLINRLARAAGDEEAVLDVVRPLADRADFDDITLAALILTFAECMTPADVDTTTDRL